MNGGVSRRAPPGPPTIISPYHFPAGTIIAISIAVGLLVVGGLVLIGWCWWKIDTASSSGDDGPGATVEGEAAGVELAAVAAQTLVAFPPAQHASEEPEETCHLCLNDFAAGDELRQLRCLHYFHRECVANLRHPYCPTCRAVIEEG